MSITSTDISLHLSGGAANATAAASLGGVKSSTAPPSGVFDNVSSTEATAGSVEFRCLYAQNDHATLTLTGAKAWLPANTPSPGTVVEIGVGTSAINATEQSVANETTAPAGVTFAAALTLATAVTLGDLAPGQSRAIWLRRTVSAGAAAIAADTFSVRVTGDTQ
jgi:hypothetical protein